MRKYFKHFVVVIAATTMFSCKKTDSPSNTTGCVVDKLQRYETASSDPLNLYFIYSGNLVTQINAVTNSGTNMSHFKIYYIDTNINKVESYDLTTLTGYLTITYSGVNVSKVTDYEKNSLTDVIEATSLLEYSYNSSGQRIQKKISYNEGGSFTLYSTSNYTYDGLGDIIKIVEHYPDGTNDTYTYAYNNKLNPLQSINSQIDILGPACFDTYELLVETGMTDARYLSKYQMVKEVLSYSEGDVYAYNFNYTYDSDGKTTSVTSDGDIYLVNITYKCN